LLFSVFRTKNPKMDFPGLGVLDILDAAGGYPQRAMVVRSIMSELIARGCLPGAMLA
jgi:hypothetical protein